MSIHNLNREKRRNLNRITLPVILALLTVAIAIATLLSWSAVRTNSLEFKRQGRLVDEIISRQAKKFAASIEAHTTWSQTYPQLHKPALDLNWIDSYLGTWLFSTPGFEETYVLDNRSRLLYAMQEGRRAPRAAFDKAHPTLSPLIHALREKMAKPRERLLEGTITPTVIDYVALHGHPAIVMVKPITPVGTTVPGTRGIVRANVPDLKAGEEYVFIAAKRMDESSLLLKYLREEFFHEQVRFSWEANPRGGETAHPIRSPRSGRIVGYYLWDPFKPGSIVLKDMILPLLIALAIVGAITWFLICGIRRSTAELQASEAQAKHLAFHDALTGLPNRALFEDRLDRALATARRHPEHPVALLCLDLDRFKHVNDTLGHPAGDELIRELARRLSGLVRETDTVARLGGDEFAIIQTNLQSARDTELLCERILKAVDRPFDVVGSQVFVGMSIGVAKSGEHGFDRTELARKGDIALYRAKSEGRGRYVVFVADMDATVQVRQTMEQDLRAALESGDQLEMYYQPQYDVGSKAISGVEALVRWHHPTRGLVCPSLFIPVAEESGIIEALGEWTLKEACVAAGPWPINTLSVNVSAVQLRNPLFAQKVIEIVRETGFNPHRLELEITETALLENIEQCQSNLKLLRFIGIRIALDDFGTGYSSFNNLRNYEVDRLKIDRSFVSSLDGSGEGSAIIRAIVALAQSTGLKVTAEGVETVEQRDFLSAVGCEEQQGFLMSRPITLAKMDEILQVPTTARSGGDPEVLAA